MVERPPPVRSRNRSSSASAMRVGCIMRTRAAASSIASGRRSSRSTMRTMASHCEASGSKSGGRRTRALDEQGGRGVDVERRDLPRRLSGESEGFPARRDDRRSRGNNVRRKLTNSDTSASRCSQLSNTATRSRSPSCSTSGLGERPAVVVTMTEAGQHRRRHERRIGERRQLDPASTVFVVPRRAGSRAATPSASCHTRPPR